MGDEGRRSLRVRLVTYEFSIYALVWWNQLIREVRDEGDEDMICAYVLCSEPIQQIAENVPRIGRPCKTLWTHSALWIHIIPLDTLSVYGRSVWMMGSDYSCGYMELWTQPPIMIAMEELQCFTKDG
ncbi:hypothetical protein CR513_06690, partial [Mucuna pruriens]